MTKKDLQRVQADLAALAEPFPTQNVDARGAVSTAATNQSRWRRKSRPSQRIFYPRIASLFGLREPLLRLDLRSPQPSRAAAVKEARRAPRSGAQRPGRPRARRHPYRSGTTRQLSKQTIVTSRPPATGNAVVRRLGADLAAIAVGF